MIATPETYSEEEGLPVQDLVPKSIDDHQHYVEEKSEDRGKDAQTDPANDQEQHGTNHSRETPKVDIHLLEELSGSFLKCLQESINAAKNCAAGECIRIITEDLILFKCM